MSKKKNMESKEKQEKEIENQQDTELDENQPDQSETTSEEQSEVASKNADDEKIKALEEQLKAEKDKYMRLFAEFDNFRKRTSKEKTESHGDATAKTISELLPAIDNFERALDTPCSDDNFKKGIEMIFNQINDILTKIGVTEIDALHKPFNPNLHNAIKQVEDEELESDTVYEVFQKGYKLGDRIIRHAMVSVTA